MSKRGISKAFFRVVRQILAKISLITKGNRLIYGLLPLFVGSPSEDNFYILLYPDVGILYFAYYSLSVFYAAILCPFISSLRIYWYIHFRQILAKIH